MNGLSTESQAFTRQQQMLAEARQARLVAQVRTPGAGQPSGQWSNLNAAVQQRPTGSAFDAAVRQLAQRLTRRRLWGVATAVALGAAIGRLPATDAKNRNRKRNKAKKLQRNSFGCVNAGGFCKNGGQCCSGICQGKKGKKRCRAHDASTCQAGQISTECGAAADVSCTTSRGDAGTCTTTTGNAAYCFADGNCFPCKKDADCQAFCGPQAACIPCVDDCAEGTACVGANEGDCGFADA